MSQFACTSKFYSWNKQNFIVFFVINHLKIVKGNLKRFVMCPFKKRCDQIFRGLLQQGVSWGHRQRQNWSGKNKLQKSHFAFISRWQSVPLISGNWPVQALYMGIYSRMDTDYNGRAVRISYCTVIPLEYSNIESTPPSFHYCSK